MVDETYVSFETAKLLKEKGFEQVNCHRQYNTDGKLCNGYCYGPMAPTLQMAMKWLREVYDLLILIEIVDGDIITDDQKYYYVWIYKGRKIVRKKGLPLCYYYTYEQACEEAIKYCLENLIK